MKQRLRGNIEPKRIVPLLSERDIIGNHPMPMCAQICAAVSTHDHPAYMEWCLHAMRSVDMQTLPPEEKYLIIDGQAPAPQYALSYGWVIIRHASKAPGPGRQLVAQVCKAEWIAYLDADNMLDPGIIEHVHKLLPVCGENVGALYGDLQRHGRQNALLEMPEWDENNIDVRNIVDASNIWRRRMILDVSWTLEPHADWVLIASAAKKGWVGKHHHGPPLQYYDHDGCLRDESAAKRKAIEALLLASKPQEADSGPEGAPDATEAQEAAMLPSGVPLCVFMPFSRVGDLGAEYNRVMESLPNGHWAIFMDHDAMILTNEFWPDMANAIAQHPDAGAIVCWTNRTGNNKQKAKAPQNDDITHHTARANEIRRDYGQKLTDVTGDEMTGVLFAVSKAAWQKAGPFVHGFGEVDNSWARQCKAAGLKIWRMDGVYIYHQRRTNGWKGATKPDMDCRKTQWKYNEVAPIIEAHGCDAMKQLLDAHKRQIESRRDWTSCQKNARRKTILSTWRKSMGISLVIPALEEPPDELAATIASFRKAGVNEIIVIDDGSEKHPVADNCGADKVLRNMPAQGVAASRNMGLQASRGNVVMYSDSHCKVVDGCNLPDWAYSAYCSENMLCAVTGSYDNPNTLYWGCSLTWKDWRFDVHANRKETKSPSALFGSVYVAGRWVWERVMGWIPTVGWGYNEQAMSLACHHAGIQIVVDGTFRILHKFRNDKKFPYLVSGKDFDANAPWTHWLLFGDDVWAFFNRATKRHRPNADVRFRERVTDEARELREAYSKGRRVADVDVLKRVGFDVSLLGKAPGR